MSGKTYSAPTKADRARFDAARAAYVKSADQEQDYRMSALLRKYGSSTPSTSWLLKSERDRLERYRAAQDRASDRLLAVLARVSPRDFASGVPHWWVMRELTWDDAITRDAMSVVPPAAYGTSSRATASFAAALPSQLPQE